MRYNIFIVTLFRINAKECYNKNHHLFGSVSAEAAGLESFHGNRDRWFAVYSVGGSTYGSELSATERVIKIQLIAVYIKFAISVSQITPHADINGLAVIRNASI